MKSLTELFTGPAMNRLDVLVEKALRESYGKDVSEVLRRVYILTLSAQNQNPVMAVKKFKQTGVDNIEAYLRGIGKRGAYAYLLEDDPPPDQDKIRDITYGQALPPVVKLERPWETTVPTWDVDDAYLSSVLSVVGISPKNFPPEVWLKTNLRAVEETKAKRVEEKRRIWGNKIKLDKSLLEEENND